MRVLTVLFVGSIATACAQSAPEVTAVDPPTSVATSDMADSSTTTSVSTTSTTVPTDGEGALDQLALEYFESVAETTYSPGSGLAAEGSLADRYAFYVAETEKAIGPDGSDAVIVNVADDQVTMRVTSVDQSVEIVYSDIEASTEGVVTFSIDGVPLADRLSLTTGPSATEAGVSITSALVYRSAGGSRLALVEIDNQSGTNWEHHYSASFVSADGVQDDSLEFFGADTVRPGARGLLVYIFDEDPVTTSGRLYVDGFVDDFATETGLVASVG